jgi:pentatricopeptide repeat protein
MFAHNLKFDGFNQCHNYMVVLIISMPALFLHYNVKLSLRILHNIGKGGRFHATITSAVALLEPPSKFQKSASESSNSPRVNATNSKEVLDTLEYGTGLEHGTYVFLLQTCERNKSLSHVKQVHAHMLVSGFKRELFLETKLVSLYANCGCVEDARRLFDKIQEGNVFLWNTMIRAYARNGFPEKAIEMYNQLQDTGIQPDNFTFPCVLKVCAGLRDLQQGKEIHDCITRSRFASDLFVRNALIAMYTKCGSVEDARQVFDEMHHRDLVSWNSMISGYAQNGFGNEAIKLFYQVLAEGIDVDPVTVASVLLACARLASQQQGKEIHDYICRSGFDQDGLVGNALVAMYFKCGSIDDARRVFNKMSQRDVVSWNAMVAGYAQIGVCGEALKCFSEMQQVGVKAEPVTVTSVLPACAHLKDLQRGKEIHTYIIRSGFQGDVLVGNALIDMYLKCGNIENANQVFEGMLQRDVISFTTMITGYTQNGHSNKAFKLLQQMELLGMKPDSVTFASVLPACTHIAALRCGKEIHDHIIRHGFNSDVFVGNALIDMYAKNGNIEDARQVFDRMLERDVISWSVMIAGYGMHGHGKEAITLFNRMQLAGMKPDHITFVAVLAACSHAGLVDEGHQYFNSMSRDYHVTPRLEHYTCMVDILGRAGCLNEAYDFIQKMPIKPSAGVWGALLGACRIHCNIDLGECVAKCLLDLKPKHAGYYVLVSNIYAVAGLWGDVAKVRAMMKERGLNKTPGCSWVEVQNRVHAFVVGDKSHPQSKEIYEFLESLISKMEKTGYVTNINFILHDVEDEVKKDIICGHSERLAIAFGLMSTSPNTPLRVIKNLRVCGDCHTVTKFIAKIVGREIIVRDANRFHHFKDGRCSCGDYW